MAASSTAGVAAAVAQQLSGRELSVLAGVEGLVAGLVDLLMTATDMLCRWVQNC